jgi:hypothetical protein
LFDCTHFSINRYIIYLQVIFDVQGNIIQTKVIHVYISSCNCSSSLIIILAANPIHNAYSINPTNPTNDVIKGSISSISTTLLIHQQHGLLPVYIKWKMSKHLQHLILLST